jgi:WW domain-containing oxidoreductase
MPHANPFGSRSTADQVLAGVDLTGKHIVITGCNSGLGFETMNALAANGAHVIGLARTLSAAEDACERVGLDCTPMACDLADLHSVTTAAESIRALDAPLDAIVANAGIAALPTLQTRNGVEMQFLVNHIGHFALVNRLAEIVRNGTGRIVIVSSSASIKQAPAEGIMFDNLDGHASYQPFTFYGQSKLALAVYAKELSRRLMGRGIAVNSVHPGATKGTRLNKYLRGPWALALSVAKIFMRNTQQGAATQALLAASPRVAGITGEYWADCQIAASNPLVSDHSLAQRLWEESERIIAAHFMPADSSLLAAA